jgi:hypothetical protein
MNSDIFSPMLEEAIPTEAPETADPIHERNMLVLQILKAIVSGNDATDPMSMLSDMFGGD